MHTQATYQYKPFDILTYLRMEVEEAQGDGRDLVQEAIDIVNGGTMHLATAKHLVALLDEMKKAGMLA